jgi:hypothetical protein
MVWRFSLGSGRCVADLANLYSRPSLQRAGGHLARA